MSAPVVRIALEIPQTAMLNRGLPDIMRNLHLRPSGMVVLDYEQHGAIWSGDEVGTWGVVE